MSLDIYLRCAHCKTDLYSANATHNLRQMWVRAAVDDALYKSEGKKASEVAEVLGHGLRKMLKRPDEFRALNPSNGWGTYELACDFLYGLVKACQDNPDAVIHVWA